MRTFLRPVLLVTTLCLVAGCTGLTDCVDCGWHHSSVLSVSPDRLLDSAAVGSSTSKLMAIEIMNQGGGELRWRATIKHGSPWLTMAPDTGTAGLTPAPQLQANPTGLVAGSYRDTVVVADRAGTGTLAVPVEFRIFP